MPSYRTFKITHDTVHVGVFNYIFIASAEFTQEIYYLTDPFYGLNLKKYTIIVNYIKKYITSIE